MKQTITYEAEEKQDETVSAFLMLVLEFASEIGLFGWLERLVKVKMKQVRYGLVNKAQTVIASLVMGCANTKAINETLGDEIAAANYLGMDRFPDQSQINRYLTRFSAENVDELGAVHAHLFMQQSQARRAAGLIVVDIDQCGLVANGQTYELKSKGYFPRKRGEEGYQLAAAFVGAYDEAVHLYLDPGNSSCHHRLPDLLRETDRLLAADNPGVTLIRRLDAGYDSGANRQGLTDLPGYCLLKSAQPDLARQLAQTIPLQDWWPVMEGVHGTELPPKDGLRRLLYELYQPDGHVEYSLLYTNLPVADFGVLRCFEFYNERQTIEAFFATSRQVYNIQNLRSRKFNAIYAFLRFVLLTHNLIHWTQHARFAQSDLEQITTQQLVLKVARVRAHVSWDSSWHLLVLETSRWATFLLDALKPRAIQLELPFARLHKT